ncbi:MAG: hypothetical protein QOF11_1360, partial [Chloroflexota bacterium]|nr:hypothetical protein [Chloroflexota bacterium]
QLRRLVDFVHEQTSRQTVGAETAR